MSEPKKNALVLHLASGTYRTVGWAAWGKDREENVTSGPAVFYVSGGPRRGLVDLEAVYSVTDLTSHVTGAGGGSRHLGPDPRSI